MRLHFTIRNLLCLTAFIAVLIGWLVDRRRLEKRLEDPVSAADLMKRVKIKGVLGKPLWELHTVRGKWRDVGPRKSDDLVFEITEVNDKPLAMPIHFLNHPKPFWHRGQSGVVRGVHWDWGTNISDSESVDPPKPVAGETWELYAFETGGVRNYSDEIWMESNLAIQMPPGRGFITELIYLRMRRIPSTGLAAPD